MKYTNVEFLNVPYDENSRYVPQYHPLPESWKSIPATRTASEVVYPNTPKEVFRSLTVPINYNDIMNCNYMCATYHPTNGDEPYKIYAWIDSIIPESDGKDECVTEGYKYNSSTIVNFHLDYWRMYIEKVKISEGLVLNRPRISRFVDPPQNIPVIYNVCGEYEYPIPGQMEGVAWVLFSYIHDEAIENVCFPINTEDTEKPVKFKDIAGNTVEAPPLITMMNGKLITALNIEKEKIQSCSLSPLGPYEIVGKDENDVLLIKWRIPTESMTFKPVDFVENYEKINATDFLTTRHLDKYETYRLTADHGNQQMDNNAIQIPFSNEDVKYMRTAFYRNDEEEAVKHAFNKWLNENVFCHHEFFSYYGIDSKIYDNILTAIGFREDYISTDISYLIRFILTNQTRIYAFHTDHITENMEYIPFIEWYKRYGGLFYEQKQFVFGANNPAYLRKTDEKGNYLDRWKRKDETVSLSPPRHQTTYEPQDFIDKDEKILRITNEGYETYAYFEDGEKERVYDFDVWIPNKETTIIIDEKNDWKTDIINVHIQDVDYSLMRSTDGLWAPNYNTLKNIFASNELVKVCLLDMRGQPIIVFNEKQPLESITTEIITLGPSSSILIRFNAEHAAANNLEVTIPCTPLEITQKYMNEYILSGQRQLDQQNLNMSVQQSITGAANSAAQGAIMGAIGGAGVGVIPGAALGFAGSLVTTGINSYFNNLNQQQKEQFLQKRGSFLLRQASDYAWIKDGNLLCLALLTADKYSATQYTTKVKEFGIDVNEFAYNIQLNKGPLRVTNAEIVGNVPIEATNYIKNKLALGIYVDPELSVPPNLYTENAIR